MNKTFRNTRAISLLLSLTLISSIREPGQIMQVDPLSPTTALAQGIDAQSIDYYVAVSGDDTHDGRSVGTAFRTIQKAATLAGPGTTVHILPGVYRETVVPNYDGSASVPITYKAENGPGTAIIRGSESSAPLAWTQLTSNPIGLPTGVYTNVYYTDLSAWNLSAAPRFVVQLDNNGQVIARLPLARAPNWQEPSDSNYWQYAKDLWTAEGGSSPAACDPVNNPDHNCDLPQRSLTQLTDRTNLTMLGDLTGGTLVAMDDRTGHYLYRRTITAQQGGTITVNEKCEFDSGTNYPGLGWGSKYYVEGKPQLLDTAGEWWYDMTTKRLYLWAPGSVNPATLNIEISRRDIGIDITNRSYITLDGLTVEFINAYAISESNWIDGKSYHNTVRHVTLRYANWGVRIAQSVTASSPAGNITDGFTLEDSEIAYMDTHALHLISFWENGSAADSFTHSGIVNTVIRNNEMHHLGFRSDTDNADGLELFHADKLRFEGNHVYHVAHNGVVFSGPVIQSSKTYGFAPSEIKTGDILVLNNIFEQVCQLNTDCGGVKFWGSRPDNHVYRNVLVMGNVFRNNIGWTYVSEQRQVWTGGPNSEVRGMGGFGLYLDHSSGIHAYRNLAYNNSYADYLLCALWRDGDIVYYNNVAANSLYGMMLGCEQDGNVNTQLVDNILVNNEGYGILLYTPNNISANTTINRNLYYLNGWRTSGGVTNPGDMVIWYPSPAQYYQHLANIQAGTGWEAQGVEGDPAFYSYAPNDHALPHIGPWPDFHLTYTSTLAIDRGVTALPASLTALLNEFGVTDWRGRAAFDIGRYEAGFALLTSPSTWAIDPGRSAQYTLSLTPPDLPYTPTLTVGNPSPTNLTVAVQPGVLAPGGNVTLTVTDKHSGPLNPGVWYTVPITDTGQGFTQTASVSLLVGGSRVYLPLCLKP